MRTFASPYLSFVALSFVVVFMSSSVFAERYRVERDGFGNFDAKKIEKPVASEEDTNVKKEEQINNTKVDVIKDQTLGSSEPELQSDPAKPVLATTDSEEVNSNSELSGKMKEEDNLTEAAENEAPEARELSIFEQKYLEAELADRKRVLDSLLVPGRGESDYDATEVNPEEFIDSEESLRQASKPERELSPYYVTVDADGIQRTTFYDPNLVNEILFTEKNKKIEFTEAQVFRKTESELSVPESADPLALSILSGGKGNFDSYFDAFSKKCCAQLPNIETPEITLGNYHYFVLNDDTLPYRFAEGDSRFLVLRLPDLNKARIPLRIRTFIRKFSKQNIEKGVFFPQLITLDKDKKPLRIITGPLLKFQDETWTKHAYLQGIFAMTQTAELDERYLLINTTRETLASKSTIEIPVSEEGPARKVTIQHMNEGSLEIEILE